jgi:radical SAM-linked protein
MINKNLTEESIASTVENAFNLGWKKIKLYFMMGLPFETPEDIEAICALSKQLASAYARGKKTINVSATGFIPKAHTPFQRCAQITLEESREKLQYLKTHLRHPRVNLKWQSPEMSLMEGVFARGDRKLSRLLVSAFERGCRLDGWTEKFKFPLWQEAMEATGIDPVFYTSRHRNDDEALPWDIIDSGVSPEFFKQEFQKAKDAVLTPDCRENDCTGCGVCDFKQIKPLLHDTLTDDPTADPLIVDTVKKLPDDAFKKFEISFSKLGVARFFGHLELATIVERAVKRAGLMAKYSQGFNPSMRLSFENALPVGMESEDEHLFIYLEKEMAPKTIVDALNTVLPQGLSITGCKPFSKFQRRNDLTAYYTIRLTEGCFEPETVNSFFNLSTFMVEDRSKKGKIRTTDLRKSVEKISFIDLQTIEMVLKKYNERTIRPSEILTACFKLDEDVVKKAKIKKRKQG